MTSTRPNRDLSNGMSSGSWPALRIAAYLGSKRRFENAMADFAEAYAELNKRDHKSLVKAISSGRVTAQTGA